MRRQLLVLTSILSIVSSCSAVQAQSWGQLKSAATEAEAANKLDEAVSYWNKALESCSPDIPARYVQSLAGLAHCYAQQNKIAEAENLYKKILSMSKEGALTDEHKAALAQYCEFLKKQKRESEAANLESKFALLHEAEAKTESSSTSASTNVKNPADEDLKKWQSLLNNGAKDAAQKNYAQAEKQYQEALSIAEKLANPIKAVSETLSRLISLYYSQEKYAQAEPYYVRSMALTKKSSGAESEEYAQALRNHGALLRRLNRKNEAMAEESKADLISYKRNASTGGSAQSAGNSGAADFSGTRGGSIYSRAGAIRSATDARNQGLAGESGE